MALHQSNKKIRSEIFAERPQRTKITIDDVNRRRTVKGGFTRLQLAMWGVPWPPPKGWLGQILKRGVPYAAPEKAYNRLKRAEKTVFEKREYARLRSKGKIEKRPTRQDKYHITEPIRQYGVGTLGPASEVRRISVEDYQREKGK